MKELRYSTRAKKDLKRYRRDEAKMRKLYELIGYLLNGLSVPACFLPHKLTGSYKGCMECHVENDFLLIWVDEAENVVEIVRLGTHSELF